MAGRRSKYEINVQPYLCDINKKIREGVTEAEIAKGLGICVATLNNYKLKYPELAEALKDNKGKDALESIVNAGILAAQGQWVEEEQTVVELDEDGNPKKTRTVISKRYIPANPTLNIYYTKHFGQEEGFTNDPQELALKKAKLAFEKAKQGKADWTTYD